MPLIIDTYNVLHTVGVLPPELAGLEIEGLARLVSGSRYRAERTTMVCDGLPEGAKPDLPSPITVRFAGRDRSADDVIAQAVRSSSAPRRLIVVSSDHAVQRAARKRRCKILTAQEFLQQLADDAVAAGTVKPNNLVDRRPAGMSEEQIDRWVKIFEIDQRTAAIRARGGGSHHTTPCGSVADDAQQSPGEAAAPHHIQHLRPGQEVPDALIQQAERIWQQSIPKPKPDQHGADSPGD